MARPPLPEPAHGTRKRYQLRRDPCRCTSCAEANAAYRRRAHMMRRLMAPAWQQLEVPAEAYESVTVPSE